jgi:hypothetical protein
MDNQQLKKIKQCDIILDPYHDIDIQNLLNMSVL